MRVAIQASHLAGEVRGIGRYVWALLPRLAKLRAELRFTLHIKNPRDEARLEPRLDAIAALDGRVQFAPLDELAATHADVAWYPWNVAKPIARYAPMIVTMHDIANVAMPDPRLTAAWKNLRWRFLYNRTAKRAALILADSEFTAREIERVLHVGASKVRVVRLAADDFSVANGEDPQPLFTRLGVTQPYVLTAGAKDRRKNLALVERAMSRPRAGGSVATLGRAAPRRDDARTASPAWRNSIGFVSDSDLAMLYKHASALVVPSTYEGFGLPVLEAMHSGCAVVCADAASLPEVGGDAALWVQPNDDRKLADTLTALLGDATLRRSLGELGRARAKTFSWDDTAQRTLAALDEAARR
jgi:glycosyltransferase involved in cell wall biosynthesis